MILFLKLLSIWTKLQDWLYILIYLNQIWLNILCILEKRFSFLLKYQQLIIIFFEKLSTYFIETNNLFKSHCWEYSIIFLLYFIFVWVFIELLVKYWSLMLLIPKSFEIFIEEPKLKIREILLLLVLFK